MVRLGGSATQSHFDVFHGLETIFRRQGIELEWVLYSDYDAMVDAFVSGYLDLAWNGPLGYVKIRSLLDEPCRVIAMRDVDVGFVTHLIAGADSDIVTVEDLIGKRFAFGRRGSEQAGLVPHHMIKEAGLNPQKDLAAISFYEDRDSQTSLRRARRGRARVLRRVRRRRRQPSHPRDHGRGRQRGGPACPRLLGQSSIQPLLLHRAGRHGPEAVRPDRGPRSCPSPAATKWNRSY